MLSSCFLFFFFKQKTAYELRISDWSSDVCSSDLQGRFMFGVEMSVRGEDEREVPWDGASPGRLLVRGPCVVSGYFGADAPAVDGGGWFDTGDIAVVHPDAAIGRESCRERVCQ